MLFNDSPPVLILYLGIPVSCCIAALTSQLRWDLSLGVAMPPKKLEEDVVDQQLGDGKAEDKKSDAKEPSTKVLVLISLGIAVFSGGLGFAIVSLPGLGPSIGIVLFCASMLGVLAGPVLVELLGCGQAGLIRDEEGLLRRVKSGRTIRHAMTNYATAVVMMGLVAPIYVWGAVNDTVKHLLLAVPIILMPVGQACLFNSGKVPSMTLRALIWRECKMCAICIAAFVGTTVCIKVFGSAGDSSSKVDKKPPTPFHPAVMECFSLLQAVLFMSQSVAVVSQLYRIDVMLGRKRNASRSPSAQSLANDREVDPRVCTFSDTVTDDFGVAVKEPTLLDYVVRQGRHLVWPFYAVIGVMGLEASLLVVPEIVLAALPDPKAPAGQKPYLGMQIMPGAFLAAPVFIAPLVALVSILRGEMQTVWNWQADWSPPKALDEGDAAVIGQEKEAKAMA